MPRVSFILGGGAESKSSARIKGIPRSILKGNEIIILKLEFESNSLDSLSDVTEFKG